MAATSSTGEKSSAIIAIQKWFKHQSDYQTDT